MGWINDILHTLPGTTDILFRKLWTDRLFLFDGRHGVSDDVDEGSARLIVAALTLRKAIFIVLPDMQPHRPAFLFATGLLKNWWDLRKNSFIQATEQIKSVGPVLYFGSSVEIRDQLRRTTVSGLQMSLSDVFSQQDVRRGSTGIGVSYSNTHSGDSHLPPVVTVYAPADPVAILQAYKPNWIAIDCGDVPSLNWLRPLLDEAVRCGIPIVAWGQNPLSECISDFDNYGQTFIWRLSIQKSGCKPVKLYGDPEFLLNAHHSTLLLPILVTCKAIDSFCRILREATQILGRLTQNSDGYFVRDVIATHWRYLRSLESLAVPIDFYEEEAPRFWGLRSFRQLRSACQHYRSACEQVAPSLYSNLEALGSLLDEAQANLESHGCGLWYALSNLCIEDPENNEARVILFTSDARKQMFLFALLARHNFTEDDLRKLNIYIGSINDFRRWIHYCNILAESADIDDFLIPPRNMAWHPVIVGLPSPAIIPRLLPLFLQPKLDIMLYPHQFSTFSRRQFEWSNLLTPNSSRLIRNIAWLAELPEPEIAFPYPPRIKLSEVVEMNVETAVKKKASPIGPLLMAEDTVNEVARLFQIDDEPSEEEFVLADKAEDEIINLYTAPEEIWCQEAIRVQFDQGWCALFAPDDVINVVKVGSRGTELDLRYIRSLRIGERVLLIHGQHRQSLYDLIISRVHKHPSIELHLAMIHRWQEDLRVTFQKWQVHSVDIAEFQEYGARDLNGLLRRMRARGSQLTSTLTLSYWLRGFVLCPLDPEDLRRVSEVLDMAFVRQYYRNIVQAANRLRGLHRSLSFKLNRWLEDNATGAVHKSDDDVIDTELGLTFGDVRNSLLVLRVIEIHNVAGPHLRSNLGRLQKDV